MNKKQVTRDKVSKSMLHMADAFENVVNKWTEYSKQAEENAKIAASQKSNKEERHLRGVLKHIAKYGKNTALHTFPVKSYSDRKVTYDVCQMLLGYWTCTCPDFHFKTIEEKNDGYECKHIRDVQSTSRYQMDIAYGQGAIEAHRRLTELAYNGLGIERSENFVAIAPVKEKQVRIEWYNRSKSLWENCGNGFDESFAQKFVKDYTGYRIAPEKETLYKIQFQYRATGEWDDSGDLSGTYTAEQADAAIKGHKFSALLNYRKVAIN